MYSDEYFMKKALLLAKEAYNNEEIPVGAVIVKDNVIIAEAYNQKDSAKMVTKHAELIAIEKQVLYKKIGDYVIQLFM